MSIANSAPWHAATPWKVDERDERSFIAVVSITVQTAIEPYDRFGVTLADHKRFAAGITVLRPTVREIWRDLLHVTDPYES